MCCSRPAPALRRSEPGRAPDQGEGEQADADGHQEQAGRAERVEDVADRPEGPGAAPVGEEEAGDEEEPERLRQGCQGVGDGQVVGDQEAALPPALAPAARRARWRADARRARASRIPW
ncbi:hypothetical protein A6A07_33995 [Streptomyces sp. CB03911]|nr:hypothetical protein A6A07_33995 [Streptomyces sp. CB03911]